MGDWRLQGKQLFCKIKGKARNVLRRHKLLDEVDPLAEELGLPEVPLLDQFLQPKRLIQGGLVVGLFLLLLVFAWEGRGKVMWIAICLALFGYIFTSGISIRNRVKQHTFDLITKTRFNDKYVDGVVVIHRAYDNTNRITKKDIKRIFTNPTEKDVEFRKSLATVFNIYEIIALSVYFKDANERIIREGHL